MKPKSEKQLLRRFLKIQEELKAVKELYAEIEEITNQLVAGGFQSGTVDGSTIVLIDNFQTKNVCFRTTSIKRLELKIMDRVKE